jgi:hypothetical protein
MHSLIDNGALLRITLAGALVLTGAACSRSDRAEVDRDTSQADTVAPGTRPGATDNARQNVSGYQPMRQDTALTPSGEVSAAGVDGDTSSARAQGDTVAVGDSAHVGKTGERLEPSQAVGQANADTAANKSESDRVRSPEDSTETVGVTTDTTTTAGVAADTGAPAEMARDTSLALAQGDTAMRQPSEVKIETADTSAIQVRPDTTAPSDTAVQQQPELGVETDDTTAVEVQVDTTTAEPEGQADLATETERVRPPEDSTQLQGNVTETVDVDTGNAEVEAGADTAGVAAAEMPSTGNIATGAHAVALMSREGRRCTVADVERNREVQWDLAGSPATMNPCGTGTMTLPRVQMEK